MDGLCGSLSALPSSVQLLSFSLRLRGLSVSADLPVRWVASHGVGSLPLLQLPLRSASPILISFSFFAFVLPCYVEVFLLYREV